MAGWPEFHGCRSVFLRCSPSFFSWCVVPPPPVRQLAPATGRPSVAGGGEPQRDGAPDAAPDPRAAVDDPDATKWTGCGCGRLLGRRRRGCWWWSTGFGEERRGTAASHYRPSCEARVNRRRRSGEAGGHGGSCEGVDCRWSSLRPKASIAGHRLRRWCRYNHVGDDPNSFCLCSKTADADGEVAPLEPSASEDATPPGWATVDKLCGVRWHWHPGVLWGAVAAFGRRSTVQWRGLTSTAATEAVATTSTTTTTTVQTVAMVSTASVEEAAALVGVDRDI
jgi:hypothetical protein